MGVKRPVEMHIEELVLHGLPASDPEAIRAAVEREMARLLTERAPRFTDGESDPGGDAAFDLGLDATPQSLGTHLANSLYGRFKR